MPNPECEMCGDPFDPVVICSECSDAIAVDQIRMAVEAERERCITKTVGTLIAWKIPTLGIPIETIREGIREALDPKN